jgi:hypothetical protein
MTFPNLNSKWWKALFVVSLMLNLAVVGMIVGAKLQGFGPGDRLMGASYVQLIPRKFFHDLTRDRRNELMKFVRDNRDDFRSLRAAADGTSLKLADALERETFSLDEVKSTVNEFATGTQSLAARGGDVVVKIVEQLTPEERKDLAAAIRARGKRK